MLSKHQSILLSALLVFGVYASPVSQKESLLARDIDYRNNDALLLRREPNPLFGSKSTPKQPAVVGKPATAPSKPPPNLPAVPPKPVTGALAPKPPTVPVTSPSTPGKANPAPPKAPQPVSPPTAPNPSKPPPAKQSSTLAVGSTCSKTGAKPKTRRIFNETVQLEKRTDGCGTELRDQPIARQGCTRNARAYNANRTGNRVSSPPVLFNTLVPEVQDELACDHVVELQALKETVDANGACKALDAILEAGGIKTAEKKEELIAPLRNIINADANTWFLDSKINQKKKTIVASGLRLPLPLPQLTLPNPADAGAQAVKVYFADANIQQISGAITQQLDAAVITMLDNAARQAEQALAARLDPCNTRQQGSTADSNIKITNARAQFPVPGTPTLHQVWSNILAVQ